MSVAKVIEIICEGKSIEDAINNGLKDIEETVRHVKQIDLKHVHAIVKDHKVVSYRVDIKVSFVVER